LNPGKIFYRWHHAGLINRIMSLEIAIGLAHCTGKEIILYNGKDHNKSAIDTPSLRGQDNVGRRESIITRDDTSPLDLIDYDSTGISEIINLDNIFKFSESEVLFEDALQNFYYTVTPGEEETSFADGRDLLTFDEKDFHLSGYNISHYSRFFFGRTKELDEKLSTVKFKKEYIEFADLVSNYLGEFNGVHVRLTDHQPVFRTREEMISDQISKFDSSPIIVLTDDINHKMFKNKNIQFLDDIIVDNFSKEFMSLPIHSEIAYGAVCVLIMAKSKDFVGTFGSTFTGYIHRIRNQNDLPQNFKFIGMEKPEFGSPYSWNDIHAGTVKSIEFEWPESRLMV